MTRITEVNFNFGNTPIVATNPTTLFKTIFENNEKTEKENGNFFRSKLSAKSFNQNFKAYQIQNLPYG